MKWLILICVSASVFASDPKSPIDEIDVDEINMEEDDKSPNLIRKNPVINGLRNIFKKAKSSPTEQDLAVGKYWNCRQFQGIEIDSPVFVSMTTRQHSFENWGGVIEDLGPMSAKIRFYAYDQGELAGLSDGGELIEAIRVTEKGDLIIEASVMGLNYFRSFLGGFFGRLFGGKKEDSIYALFQKTMLPAIALNSGLALAASYTLCPLDKVSVSE